MITDRAGKLFVTTAPAATTHLSPRATFLRITERAPTQHPFPMTTLPTCIGQSATHRWGRTVWSESVT